MILEWIRFTVAAVLIVLGLCSFGAAVLGAYRFGFVLNRMHAAGIGDTAGIFFVIASLAVARGLQMDTLKLVVLVFFLWFTSPVSAHFLGQVEYYTNPLLGRHVKPADLPEPEKHPEPADLPKQAELPEPAGEKTKGDGDGTD